MMIVVRPLKYSASVLWISCSVCISTLEVVSSKIRMAGFLSLSLIHIYGGEEFCGIAPNMDQTEAIEEGKRFCQAVEALKLATAEPDRYVTVSIGIYTAVPCALENWREMLAKADRALYAAKKSGKNCAYYYADSEMVSCRENKSGN